jgi:hypothetical protein
VGKTFVVGPNWSLSPYEQRNFLLVSTNVGHQFTGHIFGVAIALVCHHNDAISRVYDLRLCI